MIPNKGTRKDEGRVRKGGSKEGLRYGQGTGREGMRSGEEAVAMTGAAVCWLINDT